MAAFRVLYVDDEPELLEIGKMFLEQGGKFTVDTIASAPAALALLDTAKYDAIISDYQMPEMDGIEFLKKVRTLGNSIPFILFTGRGREEVVIQAINEGADFYLQKGGSPTPQFTELSHKIRQAVQKRQAERMLMESQEQLRTFVDSIQVGILTIDATTHKILNANPKAIAMIGADAGEIVGQVCHQFICPAQAGKCPVTDLKLKVDLSERVLLDRNGRKIPILKSVVPTVLDGREVLVESFFDLSGQKQTEKEIREKNLRLTTINNLEREFAELPSGKRVEEMAAKKLSALSGAVVTVFSTYYPVEQLLRTTVIEFAPGILESLPGSWEKVTRLMGMKPDEVFVPVSKEMYHDINRSVIGIKKTITEISYGKIPPLVSASIQKLSGIDRFIHIAHIIDGELYGTSVIGLRPDRPDPSAELLDSFAHIVAVSLRRQRAEAALRESEEFSRGLVENLPDYIVIYGKDGKILYVNPASAAALGYSTEELTGKPVLAFVAEDYRETVSANLASGRINRNIPAYEIAIVRKDGFRRSVIVQGTSLQFHNTPATLLVLTDITDRSRAGEALRESEGKFRALVDQTLDGIVIVDLTGNLLFANASATRLTGYAMDVVGTMNVLDIVAPEYRLRALADFARVAAGTDGYLVQYKILNKEKKELWIECIGKKISFAGSSAMILSIRDITERRQTEDEGRQKNLRLTAINELERDFAELPPGKHVEELAAKKLLELSGAVVAVFLLYDPVERMLRPTVFEYAPGIRERLPGALKKVTQMLGKDPKDVRIPVSEKMFHDMNGCVIGMKKTITELTYGLVRPLVSSGLHTLSGIDRFIHVAHSIDGELYGASVIGLRPDRPDPSQELLESFSHMVAVSLRRLRAEAALRESEESYRGLFNTVRQAIYILDSEGKFIDVNKGAEAMYGYTREEFAGKTPEFLSAPGRNDFAAVVGFLQKAFAGEPQEFEFWGMRKNGDVFPKDIRLYKGTYFGRDAIIAIGTDITQRKHSEERLAEINHTFLAFSPDPLGNITLLTGLAGRMLQGSVALYNRIEEGKLCSVGMWNTPPDFVSCDDPKGHICTDIILNGESPPTVIRNLLESPYAETDPNVRRYQLRTYVGIPVKIGEKQFGSLCVAYLDIYSPTIQDLEILSFIAKAVAIEDERRNAGKALFESEEKFRSLVEYALESILIVDFEGKILFANSAAARTIEMDSHEGLVGRNVMEFIAPESREDVIKDFTQVAQGHDAYLAKYSALSAQGKRIRLECIGKVIRYEGKPADLLSIRDITESEKAVDALKESEEKYRTLASQLPEYVFIHRSGILQYVNQAVTDITGRSSADLCGQSLMEFIAPESQAVVEENIRLRDQGNPHSTYEAAILVKDGEKRYGIVNSALISYEGTPASLVVISDITRRRTAEEALRRSNHQLTLLSGITRHDISNQLLTLNGFVTLLHGKMPDPVLEKFFSRITEASSRITAMIQFTREYEQIGTGSPVWQDLRALVNTAGNEILFGRVVLKNDILSGTEIFADPLIARVIFNLMDNALRHGGSLTTIRFSSETQNGDRIIRCEDDGSGVIPVDKERIFDRGFGRNTGYGLAISREILEITGMTIRETGEPGKGARFEITVPEGAYRVAGG